MAFVPVVSSALSQIQYDRETQLMTVNFGEKFYEYIGVTQEDLLDVMFADSIGSTFDRLIKKGSYAFREVAADAV